MLALAAGGLHLVLPEIRRMRGGGEKGGSTFEEESEMNPSGPVRVEIPFRPQREMRRDSRSTCPERSCRCVLFICEIVLFFGHVHRQRL